MLTHGITIAAVLFASAPQQNCLPGRQLACACPDGSNGVQVCSEDGLSFGPCECAAYEEYDEYDYVEEVPPPRRRRRPARLAYEEGMTIPPGYELRTRTRWGMVAPGMAVAIGLYLLSGFVASIIDSGDPSGASHRWLYVPAVGPFITAGTRFDGDDDGLVFLLVWDGILQSAGMVVAIWGAFLPQKYLIQTSRLSIAPVFGPDGVGVRASF